MTQMRKIIAQRMIESRRTSAHVHAMFEVDITRIVHLRNKTKTAFEQRHGARLTFMPFFVRAAIIALQQFPIVNASVEGESIRYHRNVNAGIAVALDWGLIVPVLKNADDLNFLGLQRGITDLGERARAKKLKPEEVEGSTFTITNPGQFGAVFGLPIINQPNSAILGVGGITKAPLVVTDADGNDSIAIRSVVHLTLGSTIVSSMAPSPTSSWLSSKRRLRTGAKRWGKRIATMLSLQLRSDRRLTCRGRLRPHRSVKAGDYSINDGRKTAIELGFISDLTAGHCFRHRQRTLQKRHGGVFLVAPRPVAEQTFNRVDNRWNEPNRLQKF